MARLVFYRTAAREHFADAGLVRSWLERHLEHTVTSLYDLRTSGSGRMHQLD
jgi:alcohol dehydrogenase YqhD (iron-dependent ADH family)